MLRLISWLIVAAVIFVAFRSLKNLASAANNSKPHRRSKYVDSTSYTPTHVDGNNHSHARHDAGNDSGGDSGESDGGGSDGSSGDGGGSGGD